MPAAFFIQYPLPVQMRLLAARKEEKARLIRNQNEEIEILVDNPASALVVSRKDGGDDYLPVKVILFTDLQNHSFSFSDQSLDRDMTYTYKTEALESSGNVIGVSNEVTR